MHYISCKNAQNTLILIDDQYSERKNIKIFLSMDKLFPCLISLTTTPGVGQRDSVDQHKFDIFP